MKVYTLAPRENWVVDRLVQEWRSGNLDIDTENPMEADVIWLMADWCWNHLPAKLLKKKIVVATVWHIVPGKFGEPQKREFIARDQLVDFYHAPSLKSKEQIESLGLTTKPIFHQLPWVNQDLWFPMNKEQVREKLGINTEVFLIGSFQRDTEGHDLKSPKLEKGPDRFCDQVENLSRLFKSQGSEIQVLLGAWRRQYVMNRLDQAGIKYHFMEKPPEVTLNEMYNALDLYIVASRYEGGPQAIVECAATRTPVVSTNVGLASEILAEKSLFDPNFMTSGEIGLKVMPDVDYAYEKVSKLFIPNSFTPFRSTFEKMVRGDM